MIFDRTFIEIGIDEFVFIAFDIEETAILNGINGDAVITVSLDCAVLLVRS